ncbi:MAG: amidase [Chloroflexi bacterium]|nr:amidase [Chloroflexota bacterium]
MMSSGGALLSSSIREIGVGYRARSWSPVDVTRAVLSRIEITEPSLHAWVRVDSERALASAAKAEREIEAGTDRGPLHGIPVGIKDIFDVAGWPTRCGSASLDDAPPAVANSQSVQALIDGGATILGKTTTQEFAAGTISPPARNPWHPQRIPGGSSGGSAAAVAVGACFGAMGSDTGGSIRIPAAACGVTGFKPAFGQLGVDGVFPLSWSLDTIGPIARTVDDTRLMWSALRNRGSAGPLEDLDGAAVDLRHLRIGVSRAYFFDALQPEVRSSVCGAIDKLSALGATVVDAPWPDAAAARACAFLINRVETAAVHEPVAVEEPDRFARYGADLRLRVAAGRGISATLYLKAMRARAGFKDSIARLFAEHQIDILLVPSLPTTAISADRLVVTDTGVDESVGVAWTRLTMPFNATGQPVIALPCSLDRDHLPIGIQLAGIPGQERALFEAAALVEGALAFHTTNEPPVRSVTSNGGHPKADS